jgi:hypothetical protein
MDPRTRGLLEETIDEDIPALIEFARVARDTSDVSTEYVRGMAYALLILELDEEEPIGSLDEFEDDGRTIRRIIDRRESDIQRELEGATDRPGSGETRIFEK